MVISGVSCSMEEIGGCCLVGEDVGEGAIVIGSSEVVYLDESWLPCRSVGDLGRRDFAGIFLDWSSRCSSSGWGLVDICGLDVSDVSRTFLKCFGKTALSQVSQVKSSQNKC